MKNTILFFSFIITTGVFANPLHLDLEMSSNEYQRLLEKNKSNKSFQVEDPAIEDALILGERLSKWVALVNSGRTAETAIRLTSATTRRGIPIDKPNSYSPAIIKKDTIEILSELPTEMKSILTSTTSLPSTLPIDDETFIKYARRVDRNYQSAARYKSVDKFRSHYTSAANKDVRGYHYLMTNKIGENELRDVTIILAEKITPIKEALTLVCLNATSNLEKCKTDVAKAFTENTVAQLYNKHIKASKKTWDDFFKIPVWARRSDVDWKGNTATIPFNTPKIPKFIPYLQNNIEDEFRWGNWSLKMIFGSFVNGPLLKFEPGVVPHVNGLGGNEIVMDSNQPIEEYESQWTIRHEFGHVVGLPDCYHEFYDVTAKAYVNYQLDVTDLMCSRAGNMNERIFLELKNAYAH